MKTSQDLFQERLNRIQTAVALGRPDRVPVVTTCTGFAARYTGTKMAEFCANPKLAAEIMLSTIQEMGEIDGTQFALFSPYLLSMGMGCKVDIPGVELHEDMPYQIHETELMKESDYDFIIEKGYDEFYEKHLEENLPDTLAHLGEAFEALPQATMNVIQAGLPILSPAIAAIPFEQFSGIRSMARFVSDTFRIPEKVLEASEIAMESTLSTLKATIQQTHPMGVFIGFGRSNRGSLSKRQQEKFVYPHFRRIVDAVIAEGAIPLLHCDQDWTQDAEFLLSLPKGKCILQLDGASDIFALKKSVGHHMCLMGDVQAAKLALGTPDEVYAYSRRLVEEVGPEGFILSQGCDMPTNAKAENYRAMVSAVHA
ncbi:uroporphyrinogen decarboxylase family protein [Holophaga foetida]|uniref:uroporphyrinogen decarboxylase family protein n=1 Tax=Holophaga foetida TaxID=35839 RepID=UPI00024725FB|nr:uroporphyrinogen decarboxylase family protein [Holophaga foetida]